MRYFDKKNNRLVYIFKRANSKFWDKKWTNTNLKKSILSTPKNNLVTKTTKKFIKPFSDKKILEGGCGNGHFVYSLQQNGYSAFGIDYARQTVTEINKIFSSLHITTSSVKKIPFPNNYFDGYWSLGVIEHFFNGYKEITREMERVIKPNSYLFITFPYMSPLRKIKTKFNHYPIFNSQKLKTTEFYQFALDAKKVQEDLEKLSFVLIKKKPLDAIKGLKDEIPPLKKHLQKFYDSQNIFVQIAGFLLFKPLTPLTGHSILLIFKKNA